MADFEEIKNKVKKYLEEKEQLDSPSCYAITKALNEDYWDEWQGEDDAQPDDTDIDDDFGDDENETEEEIDVPEEIPQLEKPLIKKPKIKIKK